MRIAQVAPLYESVPPQLYGGTERVVSYLTEELVEEGHDVTLFASGDSRTRARLVPVCARSLRLDPEQRDQLAHHVLMLEEVAKRAAHFDVIHFHIDYLHYPLSRRQRVPQLTTLHGRLDMPELGALYAEFRDMPVVSISDAQRAPLSHASWLGTVHHGLPVELLRFSPGPGSYLAFVGRTSPEKGLDRAIEIARRAGIELRIAAKVDDADRDYFREVIEPLLDGPLVEFVGEIGEAEKEEFLGNALALLFPIDWPEPFGLVMIEAMACGTPVIAFPGGSVVEIVEPGRNGFIVPDAAAAVAAVGKAGDLDRSLCRELFEVRFSAQRMARDYLELYERVLELDRSPRPISSRPAPARRRPCESR
ncbi:MAG TPA: glycosyltransferase family 4 protein [Myxococcota bacterium]|nr:glycosyltransferase family 4 protein [Myxococcota bacterium]